MEIKPIFVSKKIEDTLKPKEDKPPLVNDHCVVYHFQCDLCEANYVGFTARHLHQRISEHKYSAIGKHYFNKHGNINFLKPTNFKVLKKCITRWDYLILSRHQSTSLRRHMRSTRLLYWSLHSLLKVSTQRILRAPFST